MTEKEAIKHVGLYVIGFCEDMPKQIIEALDILKESTVECLKYKELGTVDELKVLKEKNEPKRADFLGDGYADGYLVYDSYQCPNCGKSYELEYEEYDYCPNCGQHMSLKQELLIKNRLYECIKEFEVSKWDNDNDCFSDEIMNIEKGSVWECTGKGFVCDGENRLEDIDSGEWLEVSNETLDTYFKDITEDNEEMAANEYLRSGY